MPKLDLHTHSVASPDGSLRARDYALMIASGQLDYIAVTDHDRVDFAVELQATLGEHIIVGQEVTTVGGEIIGLYLKELVPPGLSALETAEQIRAQGGLVYIPHPFETVRKGVTLATLDQIADYVDIIEVYNGRTLQDHGKRATVWAKSHQIPGVASSDAHGKTGWGNTYTEVTEAPSRENLVKLLSSATSSHNGVGVRGRLYPKLNRLRKRV